MVSGLQHMKLNNGGRDKPAQLFPLTESPGTPAKSAASSSDLGSWTGSSPGSHLGSLAGHHAVRRSPLSRNVVTALEAELDQVRWRWSLATPVVVLSKNGMLDSLGRRQLTTSHTRERETRPLTALSASPTDLGATASSSHQTGCISHHRLAVLTNGLQFSNTAVGTWISTSETESVAVNEDQGMCGQSSVKADSRLQGMWLCLQVARSTPTPSSQDPTPEPIEPHSTPPATPRSAAARQERTAKRDRGLGKPLQLHSLPCILAPSDGSNP